MTLFLTTGLCPHPQIASSRVRGEYKELLLCILLHADHSPTTLIPNPNLGLQDLNTWPHAQGKQMKGSGHGGRNFSFEDEVAKSTQSPILRLPEQGGASCLPFNPHCMEREQDRERERKREND